MAEQHQTTRLLTNPKPVVTRYNRLVLYSAIGAVVLVVFTYSLVIRDHGRRIAPPRPTRLVSLPQPLVTDTPKAKPLPLPEAPPQPQAFSMPPHPPPPPAPKKENPLVKIRFDERVKAHRSPILVQFDGARRDPGVQSSQALQTREHNPQVLEIEPVTAPTSAAPPLFAQSSVSPWGSQPWGPQRTWIDRDSTGRSGEFWGLSGIARASQVSQAHLLPPQSPFQLNAGTLIPLVLERPVNSDQEAMFSALVTRDVYDSTASRYLLVPAGSRIIGITDVDAPTNQQATLLLAAKTLYLPNNWSIALSGAPGASGLGLTGLSDHVNRHLFQRYGSATMLSLITAGIRMATYAGRGGLLYLTPEDAAAQGAGNVLGRATAEDLRRSMNIRPTVYIRDGYQFNVTLTQDLVFPGPYAAAPTSLVSNDSQG